VSLRIKLALIFAFVAFFTATAIAVVTPAIVDHGFAQVESQDDERRGGGQGQGPGPREGRGPGRAQQETTAAIVLVAILGAVGASILGFLVAGRLVGPLGRLRVAAADVAAGDLERRSGVADRHDEIGDLGRSFDSMAEALERSDAARRRLFQDAAHELKTPLTVIDATTTAILDGVYEHDDKHLETIREQSQLLARVVDDLRTVSLAESGQMPLDVTDVDAAEALRAVGQSFAPAAELAAVDLDVELSAEPLSIAADRERLRQMLGALVDNALRHTQAGGSVVLEGGRQDGHVRLAVRDSGPGIDTDDLPHLFERFYRADPSRGRASGTSGLGLAIVRAFAEAQAASVGAENVASGGARFWISFPDGASIKGA
jgi:two-component system sensor histidine kinase BaeS